jgi:predicted nucleic acid-binding protein
VNYLLDVNLLLAWGWSDHPDHLRTATWLAGVKRRSGSKLHTCSIVELGFIRVSFQRTAGRVPITTAATMLAGMLSAMGKKHTLLADDLSPAASLPPWCVGASQTTDAHLLGLATRHGAILATLDTGIPGGFVLPTI